MKRIEIKKKLIHKNVIIDAHTHVGISPKFFYKFGYPYALSFQDLVIRMDTLGIDHSVVFPSGDSAFYINDSDSLKIKTTTRYCNFPYELENKNLLKEIYEIFPEYSHRAIPFLMFDPSRKAKAQADYIEELSEKHPVFGLKTATTYIQAFVNDLETKGKPILDLAREKQFPITFHSSAHPMDPWASAYDIVAFAERHPDIRVCIAHACRFIEPVLEKADKLDNCFVDFSAFIIHCKLAVQNSPSIASKDVRFSAEYNNPLLVMKKLAETYPDTMMWGTDTPYNFWIQKFYTADGNLLEDRLDCGYKEESQLLMNLPNEIKTKIAYINSMRYIFGE